MSAEENKDLVRRFFEARAETDLDELDEMLAPDFVSHTKVLPGQRPDREGYKRTIAEYAATFSNRRFIVKEQVAEADKVVTRFTVRVTHDRKEFLGHRGDHAGYLFARDPWDGQPHRACDGRRILLGSPQLSSNCRQEGLGRDPVLLDPATFFLQNSCFLEWSRGDSNP